ncbi:hypothetical protein C4D60_Mb01t08050 [Musa balbisiana]|uniref:Uncharacterized protein n=1 Tax=Musa balbisiana TaxID=52838 RepID=A0A4V4H771_MUSBA|nr:hypothetical protein C4D60_Mb01t08050 [Musa balbisiana]
METKRDVGFGDTNRSGVVMLCICTLLSLSLSLSLSLTLLCTVYLVSSSQLEAKVFIEIPRETPFMCKPMYSSSSAPDVIPGVSYVFSPHKAQES